MDQKPIAYIIEDYEDQIVVFRKALEMAGYEVEVAEDGAVAQQRLGEITPDLVILDLHLPKVSGNVLLKQIRSEARLDKTRVWVATADASLGEQLRGQADLVLLKPVSFSQLKQLAERYIGQPRK
jgi:CheY-like chemotaxis protein